MRKLYILLLFIFSGVVAFAQTNLTNRTITLLAENDSTLLETGVVRVNNTNSQQKEILVRRRLNNIVANSVNYFCWTICYGPGTNVSPAPITIAAADYSDNFHGYYDPAKNPGTSTITYVFYDKNNTADSVWFKVNYTTSGVPDTIIDPFINLDFTSSVKNISKTQVSVYPNPAADQITFESAEKVDGLTIVNLLGKTVRTTTVNPTSKVVADVNELPSGVYFCNLFRNGVVVATKRFSVSK